MTTQEENRESDISHRLCAGLPCSCDTHSDSTICGTLARKILAFNEVDRRELALAIDPSLSPPEPTEGQAERPTDGEWVTARAGIIGVEKHYEDIKASEGALGVVRTIDKCLRYADVLRAMPLQERERS